MTKFTYVREWATMLKQTRSTQHILILQGGIFHLRFDTIIVPEERVARRRRAVSPESAAPVVGGGLIVFVESVLLILFPFSAALVVAPASRVSWGVYCNGLRKKFLLGCMNMPQPPSTR